jgi:pimeloyl-ACP methyl ester carboxylesterase
MLTIPAPKGVKREILVLYGHHSTLERWWGLVQNFNEFGAVTMPDLPGFGGMDSFYKIGKDVTLDNYADYMAAFVKMRYKHRRVSIAGVSVGFLVATRMLQRYPELANQVDFLVSASGFMRSDDFIFSRRRHLAYIWAAKIFSIPPMPFIFRHLALNATVLRLVYARTNNAKHKFQEAMSDPEHFNRMMDMEIGLWQKNDVRTYMRTSVQLLTVDNCKTQINLPVWHVYTKNDHFFDHRIVEQHMRVVFRSFHGAPIQLKTHTVSVLATKQDAAELIPATLRRALQKASKA